MSSCSPAADTTSHLTAHTRLLKTQQRRLYACGVALTAHVDDVVLLSMPRCPPTIAQSGKQGRESHRRWCAGRGTQLDHAPARF